MMAQESEEDQQIVDAVTSLVRTCTFDKIDADNSPMFDVEYIFLQIRGKSVGEKVQLQLICPDDEETTVETEIDINDIAVQMTDNHTNEIKIKANIEKTRGYRETQRKYRTVEKTSRKLDKKQRNYRRIREIKKNT